jgi:hypothetical protein
MPMASTPDTGMSFGRPRAKACLMEISQRLARFRFQHVDGAHEELLS